MRVIIGLGNHGEQYEKTRHNAGFLFVDFLARLLEKEGGFSGWKREKALSSRIGRGTYGGKEFFLAKPESMMNNSGESVQKILKKLKGKMDDLIVVHDDIDIAVGNFKIQRGRSAAGHKGVQSIFSALGTQDFWRVRIGIQPKRGKPKDVNRFVLSQFTHEEMQRIASVFKEAAQELFRRV